MVDILQVEEEYWRQRGSQQWILQGDANTKYFHAVANGRRRKCAIQLLRSDNMKVTDKGAIQELVYAFYHNLMGTEEPKSLSLLPDIWLEQCWVMDQENEDLLRSFTTQELDLVLKETKTNTAPDPNGLPV
jgi:hypothetical protein